MGEQVGPSGILLLFRHAWVMFIVVHCVNGFLWWKRSKVEIEKDPSLLEGYRVMIRGWFQYGLIPWVIMGAGILSGQVGGVVQYFNPQNGLFVILFYASVVALWIASAYWVYLRGGAEMILRHPGLVNFKFKNPIYFKIWFALSLLGGIVGLSFMIFGNITIPNIGLK